MSVSYYPLKVDANPTTSGTRLFDAMSGSVTSPQTGVPEQLSATSVNVWRMLSNSSFWDHNVPPASSPGSWWDFFFKKQSGLGACLAELYATQWAGYVGGLFVTPSGGIGSGALTSPMPAYSTLDTAAGWRSADGVVTTGWHRCRIEFPPSGASTAKFFLGSNKYGTSPDVSVSWYGTGADLANVGNAPDFSNGYVVIGANSAVSNSDFDITSLYYGLLTDSVPDRVDLNAGPATEFAGVVPI